MVMEGLQEEMAGEGNLQCRKHPYRNNNNNTTPPGGICAFCLQEKLGKLISSSSFPIAIFPSPSSSSSSPPSFRSGYGGSTSTLSVRPNPSSSSSSSSSTNTINVINHHPNGNIIPFLPTHKKKKKKKDLALASATEQASSIVFRRSKSTATPRRGMHFTEADEGEEYGPRKRGFWSFLYLSKHSNNRKIDKQQGSKDISYASSNGSFSQRSKKKREDFPAVDENESPNDQAAFDRTVSRSRSVGCGSRSFSGDIFERISTGFGDCTLRRVESQREGKPKVTPIHRRGGGGGGGGQDCIRERVKCGGIFSGFMITSSSSSSSSSSYWVSSSAEDNNMNGKVAARRPGHGRSKSWGWAFASPIRAFSKPSSGKREAYKNTTTTPNLNAIPSLLPVRG